MSLKVTQAIEYGISLIGIPYELWTSGPCQIREPMWAENGPPPNKNEIVSCNCAGLVNLILRYSNKEIPHTNNTRGGTPNYFLYYQDVSKDIDINNNYPVGTLLMRNFRDVKDQGHLAVVIENKGKDSKILQSHYEKNGFNGVNIKYTLEESHSGYYYEKIVLPDDWLE